MSDIAITIQTIQEIDQHPDADRLEIVKILGTQCVVPKGEYEPRQKVIYFPPNMMIPENEAERLGVKKYLKYVIWHGKKVQSRIAACRIRGVTSYGFVAPCLQKFREGFDVTFLFNTEKYEPLAVLCDGVHRGSNPYTLEILEEGAAQFSSISRPNTLTEREPKTMLSTIDIYQVDVNGVDVK